MDKTTNQETDFNWYVVTVRNRKEKIIRDKIRNIIELEDMQEYFKDFLIPSENVIEIHKEKKREVEKLFYPGYIFVHMQFTPDTWKLINSVDGVSGFISSKKSEPKSMTVAEIEKIQSRIEKSQNSVPQMKSEFRSGDTVSIIDGPFKDFNGTIEEVNLQRNKVIVAVAVFGRNTPVELQFNQIEREV